MKKETKLIAVKLKTITIQPVQTGSRLPYPYHCEVSGAIKRQDFWKGNPLTCIGFCKAGIQKVAIYFNDIEKGNNLKKVNSGKYWAVYMANKEMCSFKQIVNVSVSEDS